jgi:hypothetical protein
LSEKIVVSLGVSISQYLLMATAAISLLLLLALLWMNHRTPPLARPMVVLAPAGVLCPVDLVSRPSQAYDLRMPARAPPTFQCPSLPVSLDAPDREAVLETVLMVRCANDSAEVFR